MGARLWAGKEFATIDVGDARLGARVAMLASALIEHPASSLPDACGGWAETKAAYRLFDNERVNPDAILGAHCQATLERIAVLGDDRILIAHDTTTLNYTTHHAAKGMGAIGARGLSGFFVHSAEAISLHGVPLGLLAQQRVFRPLPDATDTGGTEDPPPKVKRRPPPQERESRRWTDVLLASTRALSPNVRAISVADREADFYDFLATGSDNNLDLLVRAMYDRTLDQEGSPQLRATVAATAPLGSVTADIPRSAAHPSYRATLELRACPVMLRPPQDTEHRGRSSLPLWVVLAQQTDVPPAGEEPITWWLLTTMAVPDLATAHQLLIWYTYRWRVERFHYTLKSGCQIEKLQLETAERMERAVALYSVVACRLQYITYLSRTEPGLPASTALSPTEIQVLARKCTGAPPQTLPDLHTAVRWIAQLGGFLGRRRDGEPGVKVLWRGWRALHFLAEGWELAQPQ